MSFGNIFSDANKRLHDTNDDLREAIETARRASPMRQQSVGVSYTFSVLKLTNKRLHYSVIENI